VTLLVVLIPSLLTVMGLSLSVAGLALHQWPLLLVGLAFDVLDGATAREYGLCSRFGARLDWTVDVAIAAALAITQLGPAALVAVALWASYADFRGWRVSGRALLTAIVTALWVL
jgi:phosphatidylglycerophosphate synthase